MLVAPSERAVVDVLFEEPGELALEHHTPERTYRLATIGVSDERASPALAECFAELRTDPELAGERERLGAALGAEPDKALSDGAQSLDFPGLEKLLGRLRELAKVLGRTMG